MDFIKKQEDEINHTISEITYTFGELKNLRTQIMSAFLYSTDPDLQHLEDCLQNPLLPYQASLLKDLTQKNNL